jgi:hypothetical protein
VAGDGGVGERRLADDGGADSGFLVYLAQRGLGGVLVGVDVAAGPALR